MAHALEIPSILNSIKKNLGITEEYDAFDADIIMAINSCFSVLTQLGVGPDEGYAIHSSSEEWSDYLDDWSKLAMVKSYIFMKTKLLFDPPANSSTLESYKQLISEFEYRAFLEEDK